MLIFSYEGKDIGRFSNLHQCTFKPQVLVAINHIKDIRHNHPDLNAIFDFIKKSTASNVHKEAIKAFIAQLLERKIIVNKRSQTDKDSYRRITIISDPSTFNDQHVVSPDVKTECVSQTDDPHKVPPDENTECDFSIEADNKYQVTFETKTTLTTFSVSPNFREKQQRKHQVQHSTQQQIENQQGQPMQQTIFEANYKIQHEKGIGLDWIGMLYFVLPKLQMFLTLKISVTGICQFL